MPTPLGEVKVTKTKADGGAVNPNVTPTTARVASVVLGTGLPPPTVTVTSVVGVRAVTTVPAAIGFNLPFGLDQSDLIGSVN